MKIEDPHIDSVDAELKAIIIEMISEESVVEVPINNDEDGTEAAPASEAVKAVEPEKEGGEEEMTLEDMIKNEK